MVVECLLISSHNALAFSLFSPLIRNNDELRKDAADALCCLAHALGEDFTIFLPSIHKLLVKHHMRVFIWILVYYLKKFSSLCSFLVICLPIFITA